MIHEFSWDELSLKYSRNGGEGRVCPIISPPPQVIQKATIEVDEEGTVATAATASVFGMFKSGGLLN